MKTQKSDPHSSYPFIVKYLYNFSAALHQKAVTKLLQSLL